MSNTNYEEFGRIMARSMDWTPAIGIIPVISKFVSYDFVKSCSAQLNEKNNAGNFPSKTETTDGTNYAKHLRVWFIQEDDADEPAGFIH